MSKSFKTIMTLIIIVVFGLIVTILMGMVEFSSERMVTEPAGTEVSSALCPGIDNGIDVDCGPSEIKIIKAGLPIHFYQSYQKDRYGFFSMLNGSVEGKSFDASKFAYDWLIWSVVVGAVTYGVRAVKRSNAHNRH
jgi:hypothetical protein